MSHGMGHNVMGMPEMADRRMKHHMSAHPTFAQASKRRGESNLNKAALMPLSKPLNHLATSSYESFLFHGKKYIQNVSS